METTSTAYCIFIETLAEGWVPSIRDENDLPYTFTTRVDAEREIADNLITRLHEFLDGHREFEDATGIEEQIVEVKVCSDGSVIDEFGNRFGSRRDKS